MRPIAVFLAAAAVAVSPAHAADELTFAPVPEWVVQQPIPSAVPKRSEAPVAMLLNDSQIRLEPGKVTNFAEVALKVQTPDGLQAGNIAFTWQPDTDAVTVNKLHILRDGKVIDVLKAGQTFTVARRETNMEAAMLDGSLTANIQPEGLEVGDIINLAMTTERVDPVMKGHVESTHALWNDVTIEKAHARISWPTDLKLVTRHTDHLPQPKRSTKSGWNIVELSAKVVEPLLLPNGSPLRFRVGRAGEATDFGSWSDVAELMAPLYKQAAVIPKSGPLRDEVEKIRQTGRSEKERTEKALQLVQGRVRYVALSMGLGGYVPTGAEATWSRRFGDCKAKSAMLLALLHDLGIEAEPVAVHSTIGDALPQRLPMVSYFNHVIVRAKVGGKTYWLDGTRTGDGDLDRIPVANFKWGLPLVAGAELVPIAPSPLSAPGTETAIEIDASAGIFAPAPFKVEQTFRGDSARGLNILYSKLSAAQLEQVMREYWRERYDYVEIKSVTSVFDKELAELRLAMIGTASLEWNDGWLFVPGSTLAYQPNFDRADGPFRDAPFEVRYPAWEKTRVTVRLPPGFAAGQQKLPRPIKERLAGIEYVRKIELNGSVWRLETEEQAVASEVPYQEAVAAKARLKALYDDDVYLRVPEGYKATDADVAAQATETPASAQAFVQKGMILATAEKYDQAIAAFSEALKLDRESVKALVGRANSYAAKEDFESAARDISALEKVEPNNSLTARLRGFVYFSKGDLAKADQAFSQVLRDSPGDSYSALQRGMVRLAQDRPKEAVADFDTVLASEPTNTNALEKRASAHRALGENEKAFADTEAALRIGNVSPELRLLRANIFRGRGQHDLAVEEADLLMREHPKSDYAVVAAGKIFAAEGRRDKAMGAFDRALALTREAYIYVNRAQVRAPGDRAGRMADLDEALKLEPNQPNALAMKAGLLLRQRKFPEAIDLYDRAIEANPNEALDLRRGRAVALYKSGKAEEAEKAFAQIRWDSVSPGDFNSLCWDQATAGILLESALESCRKALEMRPETPSYLDSLGLALLRLGKLDEAAQTYGRAIAKVRMAASFMGRAIVRARKGEFDRSEADRAEALKLYPDIESQFAEYGLELPATQKEQASR